MTNPDASDDFPTYSETFAEYLDSQSEWIGPAEALLVHHVRALCRQLDRDGLDKAASASAYLQAVERLDRRRPRPGGGGGQPVDPDQTSIFDHLD